MKEQQAKENFIRCLYKCILPYKEWPSSLNTTVSQSSVIYNVDCFVACRLAVPQQVPGWPVYMSI